MFTHQEAQFFEILNGVSFVQPFDRLNGADDKLHCSQKEMSPKPLLKAVELQIMIGCQS